MSIRRRSTTHDLASLRLHPDGSRVQQNSANSTLRVAKSTYVDARGNWIAKDAGGKGSVMKRKSKRTDNGEGEFFDPSDNEESGKDTRYHAKGKQRAGDSAIPEGLPQEPWLEQPEARTRQRIAFPHDLSFLDPTPFSVMSTPSSRDQVASFPHPASDLLKSIHHFTSCYYRERGQILNNSSGYREQKRQEQKELQKNGHIFSSKARNYQDESDAEHSETVNETSEEDEDESDAMGAEDSKSEGRRATGGAYSKNMYKAFDGSSLMAIGIVLQEYVAHTLSSPSRPHISDEPRGRKRRRAG